MKDKLVNVIWKKLQQYSFVIFLALILVAFLIIAQVSKKNDKVPVNKTTQTTQPTNHDNRTNEIFKLPLAEESPEIIRDFYDVDASVEDQLKSIIQVGNVFYPNNGVHYTVDGETEFEVLASLSGTVTRVEQDPLLGYVVEVEHLYGMKTLYASLASVNVAVGDRVAQGDVLGVAGTNNFDPESGVHVHFEVLQNGINLNPHDVIGTKISDYNSEN
ncbi:MAG: peptidoglycan DD-metalloendopeptidase family protein [Bacilli bacterium]|nr:peptidoglycan DD-metalloendopeptidase family protein [Bacilli bacterium]